MKKRFAAAVAAVMAMAMLVGCGSSSSTTQTTQAAAKAETTDAADAQTTAAETAAEAADPKANWPTGDVKIIVPNSAGGASDMAARLFADYVTKNSGKNVVVVNETGGSNTVGFETVRNAKPDGTTLLSFHGSALLNYFAGKIDYNVTDESAYTFINFIYEPMDTSVTCVAVNAKSPYNTMEDLLKAAKENPGTITCGDGFGSSAAVFCGQIELAADVKFKHVDAPDTTTRITNVIGGQIDFAPLGYAQAKPYVESGDIRLLAMDGSNAFDETVPTFESLGYQGIGFTSFGFVAGPAGMDENTIAGIDAWCQAFCGDSQAKEDMEKLGFTVNVWDHESAVARMKELSDSTEKTTQALGW